KYREKLTTVDRVLSEGQQVVRAVAASDKDIREQMDKIYNAEDDAAFREAADRLFSPFEKAVDTAKDKLRDAQREVGTPSRRILFESKPLEDCGRLEFQRYAKEQRRELLAKILIPEQEKRVAESKERLKAAREALFRAVAENVLRSAEAQAEA